METVSIGEIKEISPLVKTELGPVGVENIKVLNEEIGELARKEEIDYHLLLVGGYVKPEKRGKYHKDIDLVLYSPQLATEDYRGGLHSKFDKFVDFLTKVSDKLGWNIEVEEPWFNDDFINGSGKVTLQPLNKGKPMEILPTTEDWTKLPFETYLNSHKHPCEIIK